MLIIFLSSFKLPLTISPLSCWCKAKNRKKNFHFIKYKEKRKKFKNSKKENDKKKKNEIKSDNRQLKRNTQIEYALFASRKESVDTDMLKKYAVRKLQ